MSGNRRKREKRMDVEEAEEDRDLLIRDEDDFGKEDEKIKGDYLHEHEEHDYHNI